jgi:hypothetical protein
MVVVTPAVVEGGRGLAAAGGGDMAVMADMMADREIEGPFA